MLLIKVFLITVIGVSLVCCASIGKNDGSPRSPISKSKRAIYISGDIDSQGGRGGDAVLDGPAGDGALDVVGGAGGEGIIILRGRVTGKLRSVGGQGGLANVRNYLKSKHKFKGKKRIVGGTGNVGLVIGGQDTGDDDDDEEEEEPERRRRDLRGSIDGGSLPGGSRKKRDVFVGVGEDGEGYEVSRRPGGAVILGGNGGDGLVIEGDRRGGDLVVRTGDDGFTRLIGKSSEEAGEPLRRGKRQSEFYVRQFKSVSLHKATLVQEVFGRQVGGGRVTVLAQGTVRLGPDGAFVDGNVFVDAGSGDGGDVQRWKDNFLNKWSGWNSRRRRRRRRRRDLGLVEEDDDDDIGMVSLGGNRRVNQKRRNKKKNKITTIEIRGGSGGKGLVMRGSVDGFVTAVGGNGGDVTLGGSDDEIKTGKKPSGSDGKGPGEDESSYYFYDDGEDGTIKVNSDGSRVRISTGTKRGKKPSGSDGKGPGEDESDYFNFEDDGGKTGKTVITEISSKGSAGSRVRIGTGGKLAVSSDGKKSSSSDEFYVVKSTPSPKRTPPGDDYPLTAFF